METEHPVRTLRGLTSYHPSQRSPTYRLADINFSETRGQDQSPLFSRLPAEIRTRIFEFALAPYDNKWEPYASNKYYYRPGFQFGPKQDRDLLRTCKKIFQEARWMPVAQFEHTFWLFRGPLHRMQLISNWEKSLSPEQQDAVNFVHILIQQVNLENLGRTPAVPDLTFKVKYLTITLRHTDWWSWESPPKSSDRLGICPWLPSRVSHQAMLAQPVEIDLDTLRKVMIKGTWGWQIGQVPGLEVFRMQFETDVVKRDQLEEVLKRAKYWKFPSEDGRSVLESDETVQITTWEGLTKLKDDSPLPLRHVETALPGFQNSQRTYCVAEMTWKRSYLS